MKTVDQPFSAPVAGMTESMKDPPFVPALIVVDVQNDFLPPKGSLAVKDGTEVIQPINDLLQLPFALKVATRDYHPKNHISFASQHGAKKPFVDKKTITNPENPWETFETTLWPTHCVQGTSGAELASALDKSQLDRVIDKGTLQNVEMYSAFYPPLINPRVGDSGLALLLKKFKITDVFVVGLAADYCVSCTATDAVREGYNTYIVEQCTRAVDAEKWEEEKRSCQGEIRPGVKLVSVGGPDLKRVEGCEKRVGWREREDTRVLGDHERWSVGVDVAHLPVAK